MANITYIDGALHTASEITTGKAYTRKGDVDAIQIVFEAGSSRTLISMTAEEVKQLIGKLSATVNA